MSDDDRTASPAGLPGDRPADPPNGGRHDLDQPTGAVAVAAQLAAQLSTADPLLAMLDEADRGVLTRFLAQVEVPVGTVVVKEGDRERAMWLVLAG
ncbi:MAG TPA: hypothetical protein VNM90_11330, partial [Haliangium sp.]|nr:hypothetical protein [Haliangium sp.]